MPFNMFPFSNLHNLNMDWVLQKIKDALHLTQEAQEAAEEAAATVAGYDAQLEEITGDITALDGRLDTAEDDIDALEGRMTSAEGDISTKADKNRPIVFDWLTIAQQNNQNGVNLRLIGGSPYAVGVHPVSSGSVDTSTYARVGVGTPTSDGQATPKKYVDDADALKVDAATPLMNIPVKIIDPNTNNGVGVTVVGGPVWGAAVHPITNGSINNSVNAPVIVGNPTSNSHAATKKYVDDALQEYAEAPAEFVLTENNGVWSLADGKNTQDVVTALDEGKRVIVKVQVSETYQYEFTVFSWMGLETLGVAASTMIEYNGITGVYTRHDLLMQYDYNAVTEEFDYTYSVYSTDATPAPVASAANVGQAYGVVRYGIGYKYGLLNVMQPPVEVTLAGSTPTFTAQDNSIYTGGILTSLTLDDYPASGEFTIVFESGSTPTTTSFPATILGLETFAAEANTIYEINVRNGLAVWHGWDVSTE